MREIKFRVYSLDERKIIADNVRLTDRIYLYVDHGDDLTEREGNVIVEYTGLKDKNGVEIYEGDVVKLVKPDIPYVIRGNGWDDVDIEKGFEIVGEVKFLYSCWFLDEGKGEGCPLNLEKEFIHQVIGNVYENPELIKEDSQ